MRIEIKPEHLKGNSWSHQIDRRCPLHEAVVAAGFPKPYIGAVHFNYNEEGVGGVLSIPEKWNQDSVTILIHKANMGSEESFFLELPDA